MKDLNEGKHTARMDETISTSAQTSMVCEMLAFGRDCTSFKQMKRTSAARMETLPMRKMKARPARWVRLNLVVSSVPIGMHKITRSVAILVYVDTVTLDMLCTAEHKCSPGGGDQFEDTGVHQNAIRNMCSKKVAAVKIQAADSPTCTLLF